FILSREILPRFGDLVNGRRVAHWTAAFMFLAFSAFIVWFILSREILPRFGDLVNGRRVAHWTAAFMFLAF
ncbi:arabinosyltransferase domain-containing protein, partial [Bacteroides fragilis]|nr:arabinosyltransferase domain-containing protein [Bacteroides fragilis]